jgi:hypothetical protein
MISDRGANDNFSKICAEAGYIRTFAVILKDTLCRVATAAGSKTPSRVKNALCLFKER